MAHELDITQDPATGEKIAAFADSMTRANADGSLTTDAWHRLGTPVGHTMTADEALDAAHMKGWNVRKIPLRVDLAERPDPADAVADDDVAAPDIDPVMVDVPGRYMIVRTNPINGATEPLAEIGRQFRPYQNEATTKLLADITDESGAHIETIGSLDGGRRTFATMKMPGHMELTSPVDGSRDITDLYLAIFNHHDGQGALRAVISPVRVVCANTQRAAEAMAVSQVAIRHSGEMNVKLEEVRRVLGLTFAYQDVFAAEIERMAQREADDEFVFNVLADVFGVNDAGSEAQAHSRLVTASKVMSVYRQDATVAPFKGTNYGAYNAVTRYLDHFAPVAGKGDEDAKRARRTLVSPAVNDTKAKAFGLLQVSAN